MLTKEKLSQTEEEEHHRTSATEQKKENLSQTREEKENLPQTREEKHHKTAQTDDMSSKKCIDVMDSWGFSDNEDEINDDENKAETSLVPLAADRKRKSCAFESVDESVRGPPMKKIRQSRRLEEKRLAKSKID